MKASETGLLEFMSKSDHQFAIPIFQRSYSWNEDHCLQIWDDVCRVADDDDESGHFIGSIVYVHDGIYHSTSVKELMIIDGQQRLTTLSLLLLALANDENGGPSFSQLSEKLREQYLLNKWQQREDFTRYKLRLTRSDRDTLCTLIDGIEQPSNASRRILENYEFFQKRIAHSGRDSQSLFKGIQKLLIVDISLDRDHDDPQRIFESLNSTGLELSHSDLIRNHVLMGLSQTEQEAQYNNYWFPMERRFDDIDNPDEIDWFIRDYLTAQTREIPRIGAVYPAFRRFIRSGGRSTTEFVAELEVYSRYYAKWLFPHLCGDPVVRQTIENLKSLRVDVARPMLLELFDDNERHGKLTTEELRQILHLVENYVVRRAVCGVPTNTLNRTFANILRQVDKSDYVNSIKSLFISYARSRRFPDDREFREAFTYNHLYWLSNWRLQFLLSSLENFKRKERVNIVEFTVEHILPQNEKLSIEWIRMLGGNWRDVQDRYVHTIGNLTLTGYNSNLSDRPFSEKLDMEGGFADSPLRLNEGLGKLDSWGEREIKNRARRLLRKALQIWPYPQ